MDYRGNHRLSRVLQSDRAGICQHCGLACKQSLSNKSVQTREVLLWWISVERIKSVENGIL